MGLHSGTPHLAGEGYVGEVVCFIEDVFSRRIVGWQTSDHLRAEFVADALEMALW